MRDSPPVSTISSSKNVKITNLNPESEHEKKNESISTEVSQADQSTADSILYTISDLNVSNGSSITEAINVDTVQIENCLLDNVNDADPEHHPNLHKLKNYK